MKKQFLFLFLFKFWKNFNSYSYFCSQIISILIPVLTQNYFLLMFTQYGFYSTMTWEQSSQINGCYYSTMCKLDRVESKTVDDE